MNRMLLVALLVGVCAGAAHAKLELSQLFSNHMVIQRDEPTPVWGHADPGGEVRVTLADRTAETTAGADGAWSVELDPLPAGGPHALEVRSGEQRVKVGNVLIGDVWVCSGQSNMFFRLSQSQRADEYVPKAENGNIRLLVIDKAWDREPRDTPETNGWRPCEPKYAERFSAVGYHFGRILQEETGVPIGLIQSSWGGTPAEAWTPIEKIEADPVAFASVIEKMEGYDVPEAEAAAAIAEADRLHAAFADRALAEDIGLSSGWATPGFDDAAWGTLPMPGYIDSELPRVDGVVWLRRMIELDESFAGAPATLRLGRVDDYDIAYVNGVEVGRTLLDEGDGRNIVRAYDIPEGVLTKGPNTVAIRLLDVRSGGGINPDGRPLDIAAGDAHASLVGEWKFAVGFDSADYGGFPKPSAYAVPAGRPYRRAAVLYNAMIEPLTRLNVAGVIWYQGESNADGTHLYRDLFPAMIEGWRDHWRRRTHGPTAEMPFYFVQLPNFRARDAEPVESKWAEVREAQRLTLDRLPDTGMAITIDVGDPSDIHPTNKLPVGQRLATLALRDVYGRASETPVNGPLVSGAAIDGRTVRIRFDNAEGLRTTSGDIVTGFALAGPDGAFRWANAAIHGDTVVVAADYIRDPTTVRYGWSDNPEVNLVNASGLPASPFELDLK